MKPALAHDAVMDELIYPCWEQPKIDGVRAWNPSGTLLGRSMDPFKGFGITEYFSKPGFAGLDGEMTLGDIPNSSDRLCSLTTGAMGKFKGVTELADLHWWVFDYLTPETADLPYEDRYGWLKIRVEELDNRRIHIVPYSVVKNREEADAAVARNAAAGYEGTIFRNPRASHKDGRPTKTGQQLLRVKPWMDTEMLVTGITEGNENQNEAMTNSLGRTERSSAQDGLVPNGRVGSLQGTLLADCVNPLNGEILFPKGLQVTVSKGEMTQAESEHYWANQSEIIGHVVKFRFMSHGIKDLPRFPNYISHRLKEDQS